MQPLKKEFNISYRTLLLLIIVYHDVTKGGSQREFNERAWTRSEYIYDSVEMFDIFNMRWQQVTPMNSGRILPGIAVLNGKGKP